jgi:hypothetical protein
VHVPYGPSECTAGSTCARPIRHRGTRKKGVDSVAVARWETGQRRCAGDYAETVRRLAPVTARQLEPEGSTASALAHLARALFHGSTATAVSALLEGEALSSADLDTLSRLIEAKRKARRKKRREQP